MTAIAYSRPRPSLLPLALLILAALAVVIASYHAVMAHGQAALDAARCFNGGGLTMPEIMQDPLTGNTMKFCHDTNSGTWYVRIDNPDGSNKTMFPRSFAKCLSDVIDYAKRSGFTKLIPPFPF